MRYYNIVITDPATNKVAANYTSYVNNRTIPGALNIELDIPVFMLATPMGQAWIRVWGVSLQEISQSHNLAGMNIEVYAGMKAGLPLANPKQSGLLIRGQIYQAFGNWVGTDMTLELLVFPNVGTIAAPKNIILDWYAGLPLATALAFTLASAFPTYKKFIDINPNLILDYDEKMYLSTLVDLAQWVKQKSASVIGGNYRGVNIEISDKTIRVYDSKYTPQPIKISFQDLIGQPTWIDVPNIQFKCVMRADINVGDIITMPPGVYSVTQQSQIGSPFRAKASFHGKFQVQLARHTGNFRQPDAASWVTTYNAYPLEIANG